MNDVVAVDVHEAIDDEWGIEVFDAEDLASDDEYAAVVLRSCSCCTSC